MSEPQRQQSHQACKIRRIASCKHLRAPIIRDNESPNQLAFQERTPADISCLCKHLQVHGVYNGEYNALYFESETFL